MIKKAYEIPYYDSQTKQFQLKQNGNPVDLTGQTLIFYLEKKNGSGFVPIEKNIGNEGWFVNATQGIFQVIINTYLYSMTVGDYQAEIEWEDQKTSLIFMDINVCTDVRHT